MFTYVKQYVYGWYMYVRAFWKMQTKTHGAGRASLVMSHRMAMATRWLVDGQLRGGRAPRYLQKGVAMEVERLRGTVARMKIALEPFARVAVAIKETEYFKQGDHRMPPLDTPVSYLVQRLNEPITIAAVFDAYAALMDGGDEHEHRVMTTREGK